MKRIFLTLSFGLFVIPFGISQTHGTSIDQNSNSFEWIKYGDQYWSVVNAEVETYRDGTPIPYVEDQTVWKDLTIGAWCYYDNDTTKGKLYNWYAIAGIHDNDENTPNTKFAPEGWYVPSDAEWTELETYLIESGYNYDSSGTVNKIAKSMASITGWNNSPSDGVPGNNQALNNSSGFNAQANGFLEITGAFKDYGIGFNSWHGSEHTLDDAKYFRIANYDNFTESRITYKQEGLSVRFVSSNPSSILLNGVVSTENNQIKNVANPTDAQDAVTKDYLEGIISALESRIEQLENNQDDSSEQNIPSNVPLNGLLAYYPLDGNGQDKTEFQNHMNMVGQITYTTDDEGGQNKAANFTNSLNGYFELPVSSWSHLNALSNGSLSFWIKLDQKFVSNHSFGFGNSFMVKQKHGQGQDFFIGLSDDTTNLMVHLSGVFPEIPSNYIVGNSSLSLDTWYNIVVTWNGSNQKLYVNGNLDGELNAGYDGVPDRTDIDFFSIGSATYGTNTSISQSDAGAYGSMDNIAFWNRELSSAEVNSLYNGD